MIPIFLLVLFFGGLHYVNVFVMQFAPGDRPFIFIVVCVAFLSVVGWLLDGGKG